jgi:hypothetical protein
VSLGYNVKALTEVCCGGIETAIPSGMLGNNDLQEAPSIRRILVDVAPCGAFFLVVLA